MKKIKNKGIYVTLALCLFSAIGFSQVKIAPKNEVLISLKIEGYSNANIPYFKVKVKDQIFDAEIDLGYAGNLSIPQPFLSQIVGDEPGTLHYRCGVHLQKLPTFQHQIDKISIRNHVFFPREIESCNEELEKQAILVEGNPDRVENMGRIGWHLFQDYVLFADFRNDALVLSDSLNTLKNHRFLPKKLTEVPFSLHLGLIAFKTILDCGEIRCILY